jgi:hypothetical protein
MTALAMSVSGGLCGPGADELGAIAREGGGGHTARRRQQFRVLERRA